MKAIHGGKAKNDRVDAHKIAVLLKGGAFPIAYVYPRGMRATRDLLRRRLLFVPRRPPKVPHLWPPQTPPPEGASDALA
jgi:hypothetical protein